MEMAALLSKKNCSLETVDEVIKWAINKTTWIFSSLVDEIDDASGMEISHFKTLIITSKL